MYAEFLNGISSQLIYLPTYLSTCLYVLIDMCLNCSQSNWTLIDDRWWRHSLRNSNVHWNKTGHACDTATGEAQRKKNISPGESNWLYDLSSMINRWTGTNPSLSIDINRRVHVRTLCYVRCSGVKRKYNVTIGVKQKRYFSRDCGNWWTKCIQQVGTSYFYSGFICSPILFVAKRGIEVGTSRC